MKRGAHEAGSLARASHMETRACSHATMRGETSGAGTPAQHIANIRAQSAPKIPEMEENPQHARARHLRGRATDGRRLHGQPEPNERRATAPKPVQLSRNRSSVGPSDAASFVFGHDLLNLATLLDSLICHDEIYVNADFMALWSDDSNDHLARALAEVVTGVDWPKQFRWEAESIALKNIRWHGESGLPGASYLADVFRATHCTFHRGWDGDAHTRGEPPYRLQSRLLVPYDEASRPFSDSVELAVGTGFYLLCSQVLGVPYRPSVVRATMLKGLLENLIKEWRVEVGSRAFDVLGAARAGAVESEYAALADMNLVDIQAPTVLSAVLGAARRPEDILPRAIELRNSRGGVAFRKWNAEFTTAVQQNDLREVARYMAEVRRVVTSVHREMGISDAPVYLGVGWGPVSGSKPFNLPPLKIRRPVSLRRHAWFLQTVYRDAMRIARWSEAAKKLIAPSLPRWFRAHLS